MLSRFATLGGLPGDPYWANVSYLLVGNGANGTTTNIKDSSSNNISTTIFGNTTIRTTISPPTVTNAGSGTVYFDGASDYLTLPSNSGMEFGSGNFTIEFWCNVSNSNLYAGLLVRQSTGSFSAGDFNILFNYGSSGNISLSLGDNPTGGAMITTSGVTINDSAWHHIAFVRNGSSFNIYVDGVSRGSATFSGSISTSAATWYIGSYPGFIGSRDITGYIYDFRVTKGVARYTANYTPPPFPPTAAMPTY